MQSLEKIAQCAPAVGAKIWCLFFLCIAPRPESCSLEGEHSSNRRCVAVYMVVSQGTALSDALHSSHFRR